MQRLTTTCEEGRRAALYDPKEARCYMPCCGGKPDTQVFVWREEFGYMKYYCVMCWTHMHHPIPVPLPTWNVGAQVKVYELPSSRDEWAWPE